MSSRKALSTPLLVAILAIVLLIVALVLYTFYVLSQSSAASGSAGSKVLAPPVLSANITSQDMLFSGNAVDPYLLLSYNALNASILNVNATILKSAAPSGIYILNTDNECFSCGNSAAISSAIASNLLRYGVIGSTSGIKYLDITDLGTLPPDSILVVLNGLLPSTFFSTTGASGVAMLQLLLDRGISIVYVGQDFSRTLLPGSIVVPANLTNLPFLITQPPKKNVLNVPGYYFNSSMFSLAGGEDYGAMTYRSVGSGSIVVFPNAPSSWKSAYEGHDIAKAIEQLFWLSSYSSGSANTNVATNSSEGTLGLVLSPLALSNDLIGGVNNGSIIVSINATGLSTNATNTVYRYLRITPHFSINGSMTVPGQVLPGSTVSVVMTIFTHSKVPMSIQPHITLYTLGMQQVGSIPLPYTNASGNFTFINYINFGVGPGNYIAMLQSFTNMEHAAALLSISPISITLVSHNTGKGVFRFTLASDGRASSGTALQDKHQRSIPQQRHCRQQRHAAVRAAQRHPRSAGQHQFHDRDTGQAVYRIS